MDQVTREATPERRTSEPWQRAAGGAPVSTRRRRGALALIVATLVTLLVAGPGLRHARAVALLLRLSGEAPAWAEPLRSTYSVESLEVSGARARIYRPRDAVLAPRGLILAHGVHHLGIDEPRLVGLARAFAEAGVVVLTPELAPLADYRVDDPGNLAILRASVARLASDAGVRRSGVGLLGVSFAGGLALRVATEPEVAHDLAFVASIGGHHDMTRVARFFVTDRVPGPDGAEIDWKAHDYGLAVLVYNAPERFVSAEDAPVLRAAVRAFLHETYAHAHQIALGLSPEGRVVFDRVFRRDRHALAATVLKELPSMAPTMAAASPAGRLASIRMPVFLLHGAHDDVVPPSESKWSAHEANGAPVHVLVSSKIGHAEMGKEDDTAESLRLVRFMAALLGA